MNYVDCLSSEASKYCLMSTHTQSLKSMNGPFVYHSLSHKGIAQMGGLASFWKEGETGKWSKSGHKTKSWQNPQLRQAEQKAFNIFLCQSKHFPPSRPVNWILPGGTWPCSASVVWSKRLKPGAFCGWELCTALFAGVDFSPFLPAVNVIC